MKKTSLVVGVLLGLAVVGSGSVLGQPALWERPAGKPAEAGPSLDAAEPPASLKVTTLKPAAVSPPAPTPASPIQVSSPTPASPIQVSSPAPEVPARVVPPETIVETANQPSGRQDPAVSIEWLGPPVVRLHQVVPFQLLVKNNSGSPVDQTVVRQRLPAGVTLKLTEPKALVLGDMLSWELGTLQPHEEKRLLVHLVPENKGRIACQAQVSFTGSTAAHFQVQEPKLALKATAAELVQLGETTDLSLTVSNPGDGAADRARILLSLSEGLETTRGRQVEFDLGNLGPNETRCVRVACTARNGGEQKCVAVASADGGLISRTTTVLHVIQPQLELKIDGPHLRYLDRQARYTFRVTNPGEAFANNVTLSDVLPQGFKFVTASDGGRLDFATQTVAWFLGDLPPAASREVTLQVLAVNTGAFKHAAVARSAQGLRTEAVAETRVEGLSALQVELTDRDDPVEVGADTAYEIRVTNTGSKPETNIQVVCTLPDKMELGGVEGAAECKHRVEGKEVIFDPLPSLAPRAEAVYLVHVRAMAAGDVRFRARIKGDSLEEPVTKEESTRVYGDEVAPKKEAVRPK